MKMIKSEMLREKLNKMKFWEMIFLMKQLMNLLPVQRIDINFKNFTIDSKTKKNSNLQTQIKITKMKIISMNFLMMKMKTAM